MKKGGRKKRKTKKKWKIKRKERNGREQGKKIAENRENTRDFYKICAIYIDILAKKISQQ